MRRAQQRCVTCPPSEWRVIQDEARAAGKSTSRYVVSEVLESASRLELPAEDQRKLRDRVNRLLLLCEDLVRPLPETEVTLTEAVAFLYRDRQAVADAAARRKRRQTTAQRGVRDDQGMADLFGDEPE